MGARLGPLACVWVAIAIATASPARADDDDRKNAEASERVDRGLALYDKGNFAAALAELEAAYALVDSWKLLIHIGIVQRELFRYGDAVATLRKYLELGGDEIPAAQRARVEQELTEIRALVAEVHVVVVGGPAKLEIDGRAFGTSPFAEPFLLAPGTHTLLATRPDQTPDQREIEVVSGSRYDVELEPTEKDERARLLLDSNPPNAALEIDGIDAGVGPIDLRLAPGDYMVTAELDGHATARQQIALLPGQERRYTIELVPLPPLIEPRPWHKKWYVWTGVGVGAAAITTGTILIIRAMQPSYDTTITYP